MAERFRGIGVSTGVAVGRVHLLHAAPLPVVPRPIPPERISAEIERFEKARETARGELEELKRQVRTVLGEPHAGIFGAQQLILDDPTLVDETLARIRVGRVSARWALKEVVAGLGRRLGSGDDEYIRERIGELSDVHRRLQRLLRGEGQPTDTLPEGPLVVVTRALGPSDAVVLARRRVVGMCTDVGGRTSHTAILAQALALPAVLGLHDFSRRVRAGLPLILDGDHGEVIVDPEPAELARAEERRREGLALEERMAAARDLPAVTRDGVEVVIRANIELPIELQTAMRFGAKGVGLYRSEFLFLGRAPELPDEDGHFETYREFARQAAPEPVVVRTLDLGGERLIRERVLRQESEATLGLRAVRLCLARPEIFRPQLRGLLRAAAERPNLKMMLPLVTEPREVRSVRELLAEEVRDLRSRAVACRPDIPVGIMIEVPAAAMATDVLAREVDFISIGTNDLIQYALAVDRGDDSIAHLYQPLHPGVLGLIRTIVEGAARHGVPVAICGEAAADPEIVGILLGLGLRELSVQPRAVGAVREAIRAIDSTEARRCAEAALRGEAMGAPCRSTPAPL
jgi:phosphotransferase system enzyme I (PtsI)